MLLNTLCNTVKRKSHRGSQSVTTDTITTDIIACANEAIRDVYKHVPKKYFHALGTVAVTAGTIGVPSTWSLDSSCQSPETFWYIWSPGNAQFTLSKVQSNAEWFHAVWNVNTSPYQPIYFRDLGLDTSGNWQIEIFPASNTALTLNYEYYIKKPADLNSSNLLQEIPVIPDLYHDVIEKGALYYFIKGFDDAAGETALKDYERAQEAMDEADDNNLDGDAAFRWQKKQTMLPGFRLG
jgi:hypothetical protein